MLGLETEHKTDSISASWTSYILVLLLDKGEPWGTFISFCILFCVFNFFKGI